MKKIILFALVLLSIQSVYSQRRMENLDRGLIAAKVEGGVYINWRITGQEWYDVSYNLYRDGVKINPAPITGASNYVDAAGSINSKYQVSAIVNSVEQEKSRQVAVLPNPYIEFELHPIPKIAGVPDSYYNLYTINDIVTADLDGDGEYELIVKRVNEGYDSAKPFENQYYTLFDAYKLDGTFLWRVDVGPNLIHHVEINMMAFDFDGDGKAELVTRFSEGSKVLDKNLNVIYEVGDEGNAWGNASPDGRTNYRNSFQKIEQWFEWEGPEYLTLLDGGSAQVLDRIEHIQRNQPPQPGDSFRNENAAYWADSSQSGDDRKGGRAHRATKFHYGAPYLDGKTPSLLITRGIYYRIVMRTYDIVDKKFSPVKWEFRSGTGPYCGQGNHNYSIADVDGDGCDEIVYGSMTVNNDGTGLYSTQLGHGDAIHVGNFNPYRKGTEVFACIEPSPYHGTTFRAAESGKILLQKINNGDEGRCMAANVSNKFKGAEMWPSATGSFSASEMREISFSGGSSNFRIFWDGDLLDELVDHNMNNTLGKGIGKIQKYNDANGTWGNILVTDGYYSCNHSKGTPCLQADLFGDWREEIIYRSADDKKIRIYFTTIPTEHRIYTLMHDMQYRQAAAWQMCGYNQPPHVSYFLGEAEGILLPPPPVMDNQRLVFQPTSSSWTAGSANWKKDGQNATYADNSDVLFDVSGHVSGTVTLAGTVAPRSMTVNSLQDYSFDMSGGKLSGAMRMAKQGLGTLSFNGNHDYTGPTEIWDGLVSFNGQLANTPVWINLHAELAATGTLGKDVALNYASTLYPGGKDVAGTLTIGGDLILKENSTLEFELTNDIAQSDKITLTAGKLKLTEEKSVIRINKTSGDLTPGDYILISAPQGIDGDLSTVKIEGLGLQVASLSYQGENVVLTVQGNRNTNTVTWDGSNDGSIWNLFDQQNFMLDASSTYFTTGDNVMFDDTSVSQTVNVTEELAPSSVVVNSSKDYVFEGNGKIVGESSLTKSGSGKLTLKGVNDFSGPVVVNGGTLAVETFPNIVNKGSIGIVSDDPSKFVVDGGTLTSTGSGLKVSSRALRIGENGATIDANNAFRWLSSIEGGGTLTKTGSANLALYGSNSFDKLILQSGSVTLGTASVTAGNDIVLGNNTTFTHYSGSSANFELMDGTSARINLGSNGAYSGKLTGNGALTINIPYVREDLTGNWSAFTGKINFVTNFVHSSWSAGLRFKNTYGLAKAEVSVTGKIHIEHLESAGIALGGLNSTSDVTMALANTWTIGEANTNTTFTGVMSGSGGITKKGTGVFSLSNANNYTRGTTIEEGRLQAMNTTGSATGTGNVTVKADAILGGTGIVGSAVNIMQGGIIEPGDATATSWSKKVGILTINGNVNFYVGSTVKLKVRKRPIPECDKIVFNATPTLGEANLVVEVVDGYTEFVSGVRLKLFDFNNKVKGVFKSMTLPELPEGLKWDTTALMTEGVITVMDDRGISSNESNTFRIFPNPAEDYVSIDLPIDGAAKMEIVDLAGATVLAKEIYPQEQIDVASLPKGVYMLKIEVEGKPYISKLLKK